MTIAILIVGYLAGLLAYSGALGPTLRWQGERETIHALNMCLMPIAATVIYLTARSLLRRRNGRPPCEAADRAVEHIVLSIVLFLMALHGLLLAVLLQVDGIGVWAGRAVVVMGGLMVIAIGNLLPRTRPNMAIGIRTARTLADRQLWVLTHRVTGYVAVMVGAVTVASGVLASTKQVAAWPAAAFAAGAMLVLAFYWRLART